MALSVAHVDASEQLAASLKASMSKGDGPTPNRTSVGVSIIVDGVSNFVDGVSNVVDSFL